MTKISTNFSKILIFDFDGTICDSLHTAMEAINFYSDEFGYKKVHLDELPELKNKTARELMQILGISFLKLPEVVYKTKKRIRNNIESLLPFHGIPEVMKTLKDQGYTLGILTSNSEDNVREFLNKHELNIFDFIYADSSLFGKGQVLKRLLKELKFQPDQVFYVGDEVRDIEAARSTHVKIISVAWGFNSKALLEERNPDFLIHHPGELAKILEE